MNKELQSLICGAKKIVVKIGSATLAKKDGTINSDFIKDFAFECKTLISEGKQIVIVSSGAQVAGVSTISGWVRRKDIHYKQALAAIGQVELMSQYRAAFNLQGLHVGQLLLTKDDFENDHRSLNIRNALFTLLDEGVVPVINENDSVAVDEFSIGDNDNLSALTAILWNADVLVLFSDIDGIYTDNPKTNPTAKLIDTVCNIEDLKTKIKIGNTNDFGTGGIATKIQAAQKTLEFGIPLVLANGSLQKPLQSLLSEQATGTVFCL